MTTIAYPVQQQMANTVNFEPTGGPNGDPCFKLDLQGSEPTILAVRTPMQQEANWDLSVNLTVDTRELAVSANGFEGLIPRIRLLRAGATEPRVLYDSLNLAVFEADWYTVRTGWHQVDFTFNLPNVSPDVLDFQLLGKGPVGGSFKVSNITITNRYSKTFPINVPGQSNSVQMTRKVEQITYAYNSFGSPLSYLKVFQDAYLDTIPCSIVKGDTVDCNIVGRVQFSGLNTLREDQLMNYELAMKFRAPNGRELWSIPISGTQDTAAGRLEVRNGSSRFIATENYNQVSFVLTVELSLGIVTFNVSREEIAAEIVARRPIGQ